MSVSIINNAKVLIKFTLKFENFYWKLSQYLDEINIDSLNAFIGNYVKIFMNLTLTSKVSVGTFLRTFMKLALIFVCFYKKSHQKLYEINNHFWTMPLGITSNSSWNWHWFLKISMAIYVKDFSHLKFVFKPFYGKLCQNVYEINIDSWAFPLKIMSRYFWN